jgi:hypothetical protein
MPRALGASTRAKAKRAWGGYAPCRHVVAGEGKTNVVFVDA